MDTIPHSTRGKRRAPRDTAAMAELREARERAGLSLSAVAERLGSSRQWVSQLERCVWPCPESTYRRLREIVGLSLLLMLTGCAAECDAPEPVDCSLETLCAQWSADLWLAIVPGSGECMLELVPWSPDVDDLGEQVCE